MYINFVCLFQGASQTHSSLHIFVDSNIHKEYQNTTKYGWASRIAFHEIEWIHIPNYRPECMLNHSSLVGCLHLLKQSVSNYYRHDPVRVQSQYQQHKLRTLNINLILLIIWVYILINVRNKISRIINLIEIQKDKCNITLTYPQENDMIISTFILGNLQGKSNSNSLEVFLQNLDFINSLNYLMNINIFKPERIYKLYNDILLGAQDFKILCQELEREVSNESDKNYQKQSFIQEIQSNFYRQINIQSLQNYHQNLSEVSQWEILNQPSYMVQSRIISKFLYPPSQLSNASVINQQQEQDNLNEQKSFELAIKLQKQYVQEQQVEALNFQINSEEYSQLKDKIENTQIQCKICLENISQEDRASLYCLHIYHKDCLKQHCIDKLKSRQFPVKCPSECQQIIIYQDLTGVLVDQQLNEFKQQSFQAYVKSLEDYSCCPTPNCAFVFVVRENSQMNCPFCKKSYCLKCKIEYHNGFSCKEYQKIHNILMINFIALQKDKIINNVLIVNRGSKRLKVVII